MEEKKPLNTEENERKLMPLSEASKKSGYTPEYLNFLSRKGMLKAEKIGRNWHTTQEWLEEFITETEEKREKKREGYICSDDVETVDSRDEACLVSTLSNGEKNQARVKIFATMSAAMIILPLVLAGTYLVKNITLQKAIRAEWIVEAENNPEFVIVNENGTQENAMSQVLGESDENNVVEKNKTALSSENYRIQEISVGGEILALVASENTPLEIFDVKSESFISSKKEEEVKLVVSWKTNKPALSSLEYSKNNGQNPKTVSEGNYGFNHSVVLSDLEPRTSYVYGILAKDKWANEKKTDFFGIYTTSKPISVFDMISNALNETFGWAFKG